MAMRANQSISRSRGGAGLMEPALLCHKCVSPARTNRRLLAWAI